MHFVKERGIDRFRFRPWAVIGNTNDMVIMPSSPGDSMWGDVYNTDEGWSVHHYDFEDIPAKVTLTKVDTNRWLLECSGAGHIMDWNY